MYIITIQASLSILYTWMLHRYQKRKGADLGGFVSNPSTDRKAATSALAVSVGAASVGK